MFRRDHRPQVLAHELAHVARWDGLVNAIQVLVQGLFVFHPLVWWANRRIRQERERCCDEMAVAILGGRPAQYSTAIVEFLAPRPKCNDSLPVLAVSGGIGSIEERIRTIMTPNRTFRTHPTFLAAVVALLLSALAWPTGFLLTARAQEKPGPGPAVATSGKSLAPSGATQPAAPGQFAPVVETMLPRLAKGPTGQIGEALDLDTGRRLTKQDFGRNDRETARWLRENGLDLVAFTEKGHFGVMVAEVAVLPVKPQLWDTLTPRELRDNSQLAQMEPNKITSVPHPEDPPTDRPTVLFRTREEGLGILQVLGLSDNGTKVKIRYKMLPTAAQSADLGPVEAYTHMIRLLQAGRIDEAMQLLPPDQRGPQARDRLASGRAASLDRVRVVDGRQVNGDLAVVILEVPRSDDKGVKYITRRVIRREGTWIPIMGSDSIASDDPEFQSIAPWLDERLRQLEAAERLRQARFVAESFLAAAKAGKEDQAAALADPQSAIPQQVKTDMRQLKGLSALRLETLVASGSKALATTSAIEDDRGRRGALLIYLHRRDSAWLVHDIDLEDNEGAQRKVQAFLQANPDAAAVPVTLPAPATQPAAGQAPALTGGHAPGETGAPPTTLPSMAEKLRTWVEDFFRHNYRDITDRKTLEWGEPQLTPLGNWSIRYKFDAVIWEKDILTMNQVFTFTPEGKYLSAENVDGFPVKRGQVPPTTKPIVPDDQIEPALHAWVEKFFTRNYHDITARKTIEWGKPQKLANGQWQIRYKYDATIWDKDHITSNKLFTFTPTGEFVSVKDAE